ncbi:MAG: prepilin-type N-terminal cleavage/methylation domain-containing protein [Planctomycetota bacterium]|nr:prepilin-type N-terminal cleavage/methylation domain-containing protein [Planctomycetota bacterium]
MQALQARQPSNLASSRRQGFTLIELLIVVGILVVVATMTLAAFSFATSGESTRSASRQLQSYISGARDRAIYAKQPRGIRLMLDADNPKTSTSAVYVGAPAAWTDGMIRLDRLDQNPKDNVADTKDVLVVRGFQTDWSVLAERGLLATGSRIKIPATKTGTWYTVIVNLVTSPATGLLTLETQDDPVTGIKATEILRLTTPYRVEGTTPADRIDAFEGEQATYQLEIPATVLPNQEPMLLPKGTVVDLDASRIPQGWRPAAAGGSYSGEIDIVFSPRGTVTGPLAAAGVLHLYVSTTSDVLHFSALRGNVLGSANPIVPGEQYTTADGEAHTTGSRSLVSIFTQTGRISSHPVNPVDVQVPIGFADDPYYFAERGETDAE